MQKEVSKAEVTSSQWSHLLVFWYSPETTFAALRSHWSWFPAYIACVSGLVLSQTILSARTHLALSEVMSSMQADAGVTSLVVWALKINMVVTPVILPLVRAFILALIISFVAMFIGIAHRFGKVYAIAMWSLLPSVAVSNVVKAIVLTATPELSPADLRFDLLFWIPFSPGTVVHSLVSTFDLFSLWSLLVLCLGFVTVHKCRPRIGYTLGITVLAVLAGVSLMW